jgi:hypothetical protein
MMGVLFTGSRYAKATFAPHKRIIWNALRQIDEMPHPDGITLVEGEADGADTIAKGYAIHLGWEISAHPADWNGPCVDACPAEHRRHYKAPAAKRGITYCPLAGHRRNQLMVDLVAATYMPGALCVATPMGDFSAGTQDCMRRARSAGIEVIRHNLPPLPTTARRTRVA